VVCISHDRGCGFPTHEISGSFNFTKAAEGKNAENLLIIHSKELAKTYLENWRRRREHSTAQAHLIFLPSILTPK
jgi:phosphatidylserine/phosphatidylglycerophosphate/cardiolipin synthase-like enzyme